MKHVKINTHVSLYTPITNNWTLVGTLPRRLNTGMISIDSSWQCANQGLVIHGWSIMSHSSMASVICHLVAMRERFKKDGKIEMIEYESKDEVIMINTCISLYKTNMLL